MFWSKNKKNRYTPAYPSFTIYIIVGFEGTHVSRTYFPDVLDGDGSTALLRLSYASSTSNYAIYQSGSCQEPQTFARI